MRNMRKERIRMVMQRDTKEYRSGFSYKLFVAVCLFAGALLGARTLLGTANQEQWKPALDALFFLLSLLPLIACIPVFMTVPLARDKSNKTVETLLGTPLTPRELVAGKTRAVFATGYALSAGSLVAGLLLVNVVGKMTGLFKLYFPVPFLLLPFCICPCFCYLLINLTVQLSLVKSPELAVSPGYMIGFGVMIGVPLGTSMAGLQLESRGFLLSCLGVLVFSWVLTEAGMRQLKRERILMGK